MYMKLVRIVDFRIIKKDTISRNQSIVLIGKHDAELNLCKLPRNVN